MFIGENSCIVVYVVGEKFKEINVILLEGIVVIVVYDCIKLVDKML